MKKLLCLCFGLFILRPDVLRADQSLAGNVTVTGGTTTGNLNVTGSVDVDGPVLSFGTIGTNTVGNSLIFADSTATTGVTGDTLTFSANRTSASWLWLHNASKSAMRLNSLHQLLLYQADGSTAGITLTPVSNQISLGSATLTGSGTSLTAGGALTISGALTASTGITNTNGSLKGAGSGLSLDAGSAGQNITLTTPSGAGDIVFNTNGLERARIKSSGNVGIGTATPGVKLAVLGGDLQVESGQGRFKGWFNSGSGLGAEVGISGGLGYLITYDRTVGTYGTTMVSSGAAYVNVNSNGNVGVGTTTPADKLHVAGNVLVDSYKAFVARYSTGDSYRGHLGWDHLQLGNNGANYIVAGNTIAGGSLGFVVNNTNDLTGLYADTNKNGLVAMVLASSGNVGIGTITPGTKLDVVGGQLGGETVRVSTLYPSVTANGTNYVRNLGFYSPNLPIASGVTDSGYRIGLDVENFVTDANFRGTLLEQYGLWARVGSYSAGTGTIQNSFGVYIDNLDGPANVVNKFGLYQSSSSAKNYFAGNLGIGTVPSTAKLDVGGTLHITDGNFLHNSVHGDYEMQQLLAANNGGGTGNAALYSWVSEPGVTWTGAGIGRNMRNSGVGFPRVNTGLSGQMIRFDEDVGIWFTSESTSGTHYNPMYLLGNNMIVSGNVGIGTTNPGSYKLAVVGSIHANSVVVETGWSDYVFDQGYRLAPLSEVEAHIKTNKHLPGIPSAAEVAEHGVSLGDMQSKLLAKVEELTLHLIAQEKQMIAQQSAHEKEIADLRGQVAELKSASR